MESPRVSVIRDRHLARRDAGGSRSPLAKGDRHRTAPDVASPRTRSRRVEPRDPMTMREITPSLVVLRNTVATQAQSTTGSLLCHPVRPQPALRSRAVPADIAG